MKSRDTELTPFLHTFVASEISSALGTNFYQTICLAEHDSTCPKFIFTFSKLTQKNRIF